jgi:5'-nucleotidase
VVSALITYKGRDSLVKNTMRLILAAAILAIGAAPVCAWPDRVLVTNDDGISDPRIAALARAFAEVAEVVVVAPLYNCSGSTNYVSAFQRHEVTAESRDLGADIEAWGVDGYPGDCVLLGLSGIMADRPPDLVVCGVNTGPNLAAAYLASGTIGAARVAAQLGTPAIAFSNLETDDPSMMAAVPAWCVRLARSRAVRTMGAGEYLTVNFPDGPADAVAGVRWAPLGEDVFKDVFELTGEDERGRQVWKQRWWFDDGIDQPADGDVALQRSGWITVTPMRLGDLDAPRLKAGGALPGWQAP